jgi:peptide/nickel transport system substrate-binding protein
MPVYDTLLVKTPDGEIEPNMATEWSYNDDATVLTLTLRDDITFTDGEPFDAEAVKANLEYLKNGTGQNSYMAASIEEFEIISDTEIALHLSEPDPGLVEYLSVVGGAMASPKSFGEGDPATTAVGSGPYELVKATAGSEYTYDRNEDYWNPDAFPFDEIVIKTILDPTARLNALKSGQADVGTLLATNVAEAESTGGLHVERHSVDWQGLIIGDRGGEKVEALGDVRVRQALNYAFDKQSILDNLSRGEGEITAQTFNTKSQAFLEELDGEYPYDIEKAKELMKEAGYEDGFSVTMPDFAAQPQIAPIIEQQLAPLNIDITFEKVAADATAPALLSGDFPMYWFSLGSQGAWQDLRKFAWAESPWNTGHSADPDAEALLDTAQFAVGEEQDAALQEVNRYVVEQAWMAPWYRANAMLAVRDGIDAAPQAGNIVPWIRNFAPAD